ncbi:MAG: hypothetical protein PHU25_13625 [Deltaproteobacteria bacterium]|nr:hypothetical protein [Deltaproteobacteria bacterium]
MLVSKFWTLLLALAAGAMLAVVLLARDVVNRERVENVTAILYKELAKTDIAFNLHARKRLDVLLSVAVDPDVRSALMAASASPEKVEKIQEKLLGTLRQRNDALGKYRGDMLIGLDIRGNVVAQVGLRERATGYGFRGFPAVQAALRGYIRDDVWKINTEVFLIAARPVIEQGRYVGAVVHAVKISDRLATELSPSGVQLAFFAANTMVAVGSPTGEGVIKADGPFLAKPLDAVLASKPFKEKGYSEIQRIDTQMQEFMAVYSLVKGEAAKNEVGFALVTPVHTMAAPTEFYEKAGKQDIEALPKVSLIAGIVLAALFGWMWNWLEGQRPITRLYRHVKALEKSDPKDQLNIYKFGRRVRKVAVAINTVFDYKAKALLASMEGKGKSIDSILGSQDGARLSSASFKFVEAKADDIPAAPPPTGSVKKIEPPSKPPTPRAGTPAAPAPVSMPVTGVHAPPPPSSSATGVHAPPPPPSSSGTGVHAPPMPGARLKTTGAYPPPTAAAGPVVVPESGPTNEQEEQVYFHQIYEEFVALKRKLGEPVEQLTFDRFEGTLKKNRDTLVARYNCRFVKFQVYEKDGKASLKATPVKV